MTYNFHAGHVSVTANCAPSLEMADPRVQEYLFDIVEEATNSQFAGALVAQLELKDFGWHLALNGTTIKGERADACETLGVSGSIHYDAWSHWSPSVLFIEAVSVVAPLNEPLLHEDSGPHLIEMLEGLSQCICNRIVEAEEAFRVIGWDSPSDWVLENMPTCGELCAALHRANDCCWDDVASGAHPTRAVSVCGSGIQR